MTKERLRRYLWLKQEREQIVQKMQEIEATIYFPKIQRMTGMPGSGNKEGNPQEPLTIQHIELRDLYLAKTKELLTELLSIERAIESVTEPRHRTLLRHRYIEGLKWEEICVAMGYEWSQIHRLHGEALAMLRVED